MLGVTVIRTTNLTLINNFRDKWTLDCKIYMITNNKPHAGSRNNMFLSGTYRISTKSSKVCRAYLFLYARKSEYVAK